MYVQVADCICRHTGVLSGKVQMALDLLAVGICKGYN